MSATRPRRRRERKAPTIFDVAAAAGVSKSTVSNVVRGVEVSETTRVRVLGAIERLNYKPNAIARQFVKQRTTMLGVLVGDLSNPYYAQMAQVAERAAFRCGYTTMFCNIEGEENIAVAGVEALLEHRVAGVRVPRVRLRDLAARGRAQADRGADRVPRAQRAVGRFGRPAGHPGRPARHRAPARARARTDRVRAHAAGRAERRPRALRRLPRRNAEGGQDRDGAAAVGARGRPRSALAG